MRPEGHVTTREAAKILGTGREGAARVLASGLVGPPLTSGRARLYPAEALHALAARPEVDSAGLHHRFPRGLLVGRLDPRRGIPEGPWVVGILRAVGLRWLDAREGPVPLICTVNGFVLSAHEVAGYGWLPVRAPKERRLVLDLRSAGEWSDGVLGHRLPTPPGHALWTWRAPILPQMPRWPSDLSHLKGPEVRRSRPHAAAG